MRFQQLLADSVGAALAVAMLAGCTSAASVPEGQSAGDTTAIPAADSQVSLSPPSRPPAGSSPEAAEAFVRYWVEALNFAARTGRTQALREASSPGCSSCQEIITGVERVHGAGGYYRDDAWSVTGIEYRPLHPETDPVLTVDVEVLAEALVAGEPGYEPKFDVGEHSLIFWLGGNRTQDAWVVRQLESAA